MILPNVEAAFDENGSEDTNLAFGLRMPLHVEKKPIYEHMRSCTRTLYGNQQICRVPAKTEVIAGIQGRLAFKGVSVTQRTHTTQHIFVRQCMKCTVYSSQKQDIEVWRVC